MMPPSSRSDHSATYTGFLKIGYSVVAPPPHSSSTRPAHSESLPGFVPPGQAQVVERTEPRIACSFPSGCNAGGQSKQVVHQEEEGIATPCGCHSGQRAGRAAGGEFRKVIGASDQEAGVESWTAAAWSMEPIHELDPKEEGAESPGDALLFRLESLDITCFSQQWYPAEFDESLLGEGQGGEGEAGDDDDQGGRGASHRSSNDVSVADTVLADASDSSCCFCHGSCTAKDASLSPTLSNSPLPPKGDEQEQQVEVQDTVRRNLGFHDQGLAAEEDVESSSHKGSTGAEYGWSREMSYLDECDLGDGCCARGCVRRRTSSGGSYLKGLFVL